MLWFKEGIGKHCLLVDGSAEWSEDKGQTAAYRDQQWSSVYSLRSKQETAHHLLLCPCKEVWCKCDMLGFCVQGFNSIQDQMIRFFLKCDNRKNDNQMLAKLCFPAFTWNIWKERNFRIFRNTRRPSIALANEIKQQVKARAIYLNLNVSTHLQWKWDIPQHSTHRQRTWSINCYEVESWNFSYALRKSTLLASKECKVRTIFRS